MADKSNQDPLESQEFYDICQQYRHARDVTPHPGMPTASQAFKELKEWIRTHVSGAAPAGSPIGECEAVAQVVLVDGHKANVPSNRMLTALRDLPQEGTLLYELPKELQLLRFDAQNKGVLIKPAPDGEQGV